jgi:VanZ family protein
MTLLRFWKSLIISVIILVLCLLPSYELQQLDVLEFDYIDLLVHFIMFFIFSAVLFKDLLRYSDFTSKKSPLIIALSISLILGFSTEGLQHVMTFLNRTASISDFFFDCLGSVLGIIAAMATRKKPDPGF